MFVIQAKANDVSVNLSIPFQTEFSNTSVIVPFNLIGGLIILRAGVNARYGDFILDTGANGLVLNDRYFDPNRILKKQQGMGLGGLSKKVGVLDLDSLSLDELQFKSVSAQTINLKQIENNKGIKILGLIGYDILKDFEIMIDYNRKILTFSKVNKQGTLLLPLKHTLNKIDSFDLIMGNFIPVVEVRVNNIPKKMGIDTGAEYNLLNIKTSKDIRDQFKVMKLISITNAGVKDVQAMAGKLYYVALNEVFKCGALTTVMVNFRNLEKIYGMKLDGILGYEFLSPWLFSINYQKAKLYLHRRKSIKP